MSLVPYDGKAMACGARIDGNHLLFGKARHWRKLDMDNIEGVEFIEFNGFKVAQLDTKNTAGENVSFYIPWSESFDGLVEFY